MPTDTEIRPGMLVMLIEAGWVPPDYWRLANEKKLATQQKGLDHG